MTRVWISYYIINCITVVFSFQYSFCLLVGILEKRTSFSPFFFFWRITTYLRYSFKKVPVPKFITITDLFDADIVPDLAGGSPFKPALMPFAMFPGSTSLLSHRTRYSRPASASLPRTWNQPFFKSTWFPSGRKYLENRMKACLYWLWGVFASRPCVWTELGDLSEGDVFPLKHGITEFFLTLPHGTRGSGMLGSQQRQCICLWALSYNEELLIAWHF